MKGIVFWACLVLTIAVGPVGLAQKKGGAKTLPAIDLKKATPPSGIDKKLMSEEDPTYGYTIDWTPSIPGPTVRRAREGGKGNSYQ